MAMSFSSTSSSTLSSLSISSHPPFVVVRGDSPLLGFDVDSDDPLHFPAPHYPRSLPYAPILSMDFPRPLPPSVLPGLHKRTSVLSPRRRVSTLTRSRANSSAASSEHIRHAVYIDSDPEDSDGDLAHRLDKLLSNSSLDRSAASSRFDFSSYTSSEQSEPSPPSSPSSCRFPLPSRHSNDSFTSEVPPEVPPKNYPYFAPPLIEESSHWSLNSTQEIPAPPPSTPTFPRVLQQAASRASQKRRSVIRFSMKKSAPEPEPQNPSSPPKSTKRKRLTSLFSRLSLAPRASMINLTLLSVPHSPVPVSSPPPSATKFSAFTSSQSPTPPATPYTAPLSSDRLSFHQEDIEPPLPTPPLPTKHKRKSALRTSKSDYQLHRYISDSHHQSRRPSHPHLPSEVKLTNTSLTGGCSGNQCTPHSDDQGGRYPQPLTLPRTQYLPSPPKTPSLRSKDLHPRHGVPGFLVRDHEQEEEDAPTQEDLEQGEALLGLVLGPGYSDERQSCPPPTGVSYAF